MAAIIVCIVVMSLSDAGFQAKIGRTVYAFLAIFVIGFAGFYYVNDVSGGLLEMRFKGESMYNKEPETFISSSFFRNEIEARARHYGFKIGAEFGEPYYSYDAIRINDKTIFEI